ncbi:MAG: hypothetical protein H7A21_13530 [Spirochaetales bacterium]|nr:hypothetical protein [Leptospiraceae bacterium]MCP5482451.1 hypothetical protein [Spirochaetales bacterium]MCP5485845.1 hypothetical protein [Spirochaetales bacterium]
MQKPRYLAWLIASLLSVCYGLFHLHFLQRALDHDQVVYLVNMLVFRPERPFFNPHHLAFESSGYWFIGVVRDLLPAPFSSDVTFILRLRSLLIACFGLFCACMYVERLTGRLRWAVVISIGLGLLHGTLYHATKIDTGIFPLAWCFPMLWAGQAVRRARTRRRLLFQSVWAGLIFFVGILLHQYLSLLATAIALALLLPLPGLRSSMHGSPVWRWPAVALMTAVTILPTAGAYYYAGHINYRLRFDKPDPGAAVGVWRHRTFQEWLFAYQVDGHWGKGFSEFRPEANVRGIVDVFVSQRRLRPKYGENYTFEFELARPFALEPLAFNAVAYFFLGTLTLLLLEFPRLVRRLDADLFALVFGILFLGALGAYFEPFYFEFWLVPVSMFFLLGGLLLATLLDRWSGWMADSAHSLAAALFLALAFFWGAHNLRYYLDSYSRLILLEGMAEWEPEYYERFQSRAIYRNPVDPRAHAGP